MRCCNRCGFVWNAVFEPDLITYDGAYENDQTCSPSFRTHLDAMAARAIAMVPDRDPIDLLEIGAGQGTFIAAIADQAGARLRSATGFDPAWRGTDGSGPNSARLFAKLFGPETAHLLPGRPNLVISRHTIEHVASPMTFLSRLAAGLDTGPPVHVAIETPCVQWILDHDAFQDFFYEHCSLFTAHTLAHCLHQTGLAVQSVDHVFGGQYLWAEAMSHGADMSAPHIAIPETAKWRSVLSRMLERWKGWVSTRGARRPVYVWGAGAKGITFALLVDAGAEHISGLIDVNPRKQGGYVPLSGHPILAPEAIAGREAAIVVMNPNYAEEIRLECERLEVRAEFGIL
jgi:hypothetical protein